MTERTRPALTKPKPQNYFVGDKPDIKFLSSGCTLLDCVLGGGYAFGRVTNIIGDKSTAKTALATEALINFLHQYPRGAAAYRDAERAFDQGYAQAMGLQVDRVDFGNDSKPVLTVEDFAKDLDEFVDAVTETGVPGIYVLDSFDALSDDTEMESEFGKASYGMAKSKAMSTMFRKMAWKLEQSEVLLLIVSQVRENIGITFGEKYRRSGGKALDHYASQLLWLAHIKTLKRTIKKVERSFGVTVKAKVKKNKVGLAFRECEFDFIFGYGVEDLGASIKWLAEVGRLKESKSYLTEVDAMNDEQYRAAQAARAAQVKQAWSEIETTFLPVRRKYS